uniref:Cytochrome c n=1 Tax=Anaerolinea thermolimosa TaxID=229919 RepID=A0A7C4KGC6_9CHLR
MMRFNLKMLAWFLGVLILALALAACGGKTATEEPARPSNPGGTGEAVNLKGDPVKGAEIFQANCVSCHGEEGKGGVANPGSEDGEVPALNPIDPTLVSQDAKTFASNIDLFLEHGSTPAGNSPALSMPKFGDDKMLQPQEIADVIAYVIQLNQK